MAKGRQSEGSSTAFASGKIWPLELLRGAAALLVVIGHFAGVFPEIGRSSFREALSNWGVNAVIVFFVLSGAVIRLSVEKHPFETGLFLRRRFVRLVPLYLLAIAYSVMAETAPINPTALWGNLTFTATLPGWIAPTFESNPVLWSLSYEMAFYVVFALLRGPARYGEYTSVGLAVIAGVALSLNHDLPNWLLHLRSTLAFYGVWLAGYWAIKSRRICTLGFPLALAIAACATMVARSSITGGYPDYGQSVLLALLFAPLVCVLSGQNTPSAGIGQSWMFASATYASCLVLFLARSQSRLHAAVLFVVFPFVALAALGVMRKYPLPPLLPPFSLWLGSISYALYLFHYPTFFTVKRWFGESDVIPALVSVIAVGTAAHLLEFKFQPLAARWVNRLFPATRSSDRVHLNANSNHR
jgi:peptidoglycan/LPS O-acetylase OafA/YrhL